MKHIYIFVFLFTSVFICKAQDSSEEISGINSPSRKSSGGYRTDALSSYSTGRNVARLEEGYTAFSGGEYIIKDYLVKGTFSLIEVTHGTAIAAGYQMDTQKYRRKPEKSYYIQKGEDRTAYRQVFPAPTRKTSLVSMSKSVLCEIFQDDPVIVGYVKALKAIDRGELKKIVKLYNKKHNQV